MKDLGEAYYCLGIQITHNREQGIIRINQSKYIDDILERFGMADCKPVATPMDTSIKLSKDMSPKTDEETKAMDNIPYCSIIGSLMYAMTGTRPDIAYT